MRPDSKLVFSTHQTAILKGLAILFMLMHHCLIPAFYDEPPQILHNFFVTHLMIGMRICVGIFTFIIGYGYAFQKEHSYAYSFRHVWRLVSRYWILFAVLFLPVYLVGGGKMNLQFLLLESFGIKWNLNCAAWYVYFYIFMMVSLPVITNFMDKQLIRNSVAVIAFCVLWASLLGESDHLAAKSLQRCFFYLPVMVCGYVAAKQEWIRRVSNRGLVFSIFLGLCVMAARCATGGIKGFSTDILLVPLFIYSILSLFASMNLPIVEKVLASLGKASLYMWFLHAVFYSVGTRYAFASYVLWPDHLLISFLLVTLFSYLAARMCMWVDAKIVKLLINRL